MRKFIKNLILYLCMLPLTPCILLAWIENKMGDKEEIFTFFAQLLSLVPGKIGSYFRVAYYRGTLKACPVNTAIAFGTFFSHRNAILKENVNIGAYCVIGCVNIGKDVMIASRVSVTSGKVQHVGPMGRITRDLYLNVITIGKRTWVGEGAIILDNVGEECIISAGCVVNKNIPSEALVGGNPCRVLKRKYYSTSMPLNL